MFGLKSVHAKGTHLMGLAQKLALKITALVVALALVGGASLWGLMGLSRHFDVAQDEYEQLREIYEIGHHAALAKMLTHMTVNHHGAIGEQLEAAIRKSEDLLNVAPSNYNGLDAANRSTVASIVEHLRIAYDQATRGGGAGADLHRINAALGHVAGLAGQIKSRIIVNRRTAASRLRITIFVLAILTAATIAVATIIGVNQYRGVMRPLRRLEEGVKKVAEADFTERLPLAGDREFSGLAAQFNRMAEELDGLYNRLEEQVIAKSRQLVSSERLACVGYLAAGLAHEINNPLGIISGYAEALLQKITKNANGNGSADQTTRTLNIICEEAFRCNEITSKLLSLACPSTEERTSVSVVRVTKRVVEMMGGLPQFHDRRITLSMEDGDDLFVQSNEAELNQVLINLIGNALEAVSPDVGRVGVEVKRRGRWVTLRVRDNGRGMTEEVMGQVFDPFFTDKPQRDQRGIGLGLCVTHAIVGHHGGRIRLHSDGLGKGSEFILELPAATVEAVIHG